MTEVDIGPLPVDLIPSFRDAVDIVARERRYLNLVEAPPLDATRRFVLDGETNGDVRLVAVVAGHVVGWCDIRRLPFAKIHRGVLGLGLTPDFRGRGIGRRLLTETLERAWASRFTRVELEVYVDNPSAIALYCKVGFVQEGIVRDAICVDGRYRDAIAMAILKPAA